MTSIKPPTSIHCRFAVSADFESIMDLLRLLNEKEAATNSAHQDAFNEIQSSSYFKILVIENSPVESPEINNPETQNRASLLACLAINIIPNLTTNASPYALIENVIVRPEYQAMGLGKKLMRHAVEYCKSHSCYKIMLLAGVHDDAVLGFYRTCGFDQDAKKGFVYYLN